MVNDYNSCVEDMFCGCEGCWYEDKYDTDSADRGMSAAREFETILLGRVIEVCHGFMSSTNQYITVPQYCTVVETCPTL